MPVMPSLLSQFSQRFRMTRAALTTPHGFSHVCSNKSIFPKSVYSESKDNFQQLWHSSLLNSSTMSYYANFKTLFVCEDYLQLLNQAN